MFNTKLLKNAFIKRSQVCYMNQPLLIQPVTLNYNIILVYMLSCIVLQIITGIFLVCSIVLMHTSFSQCRTFMRDVLMDGLSDIPCKRSIFLLHRGIRAYIQGNNVRVLLLSDNIYGVRCYNFITYDFNIFLGYVLHGVKCLIGLQRYY